MMTLDLQQLQDADLVDQNGEKVGSIGQIYVDDKTNQPSFATVKTGLFGNNDTFVPLAGAQSVDGKLQVPYTKDFIKDSPNVDAGGHISEQEQSEIYRYYGLNDPSAAGVAGTAGNTETVGAAGGVAGAGYAAEHGRHQDRHEGRHETRGNADTAYAGTSDVDTSGADTAYDAHRVGDTAVDQPGTFTEGNRGGDYNDGVGAGTYAPDGQYAGDRTPSEYDSTHERSGQVYDESDNPGRHGGQVYDEPRSLDPRVEQGDGQSAATYAPGNATAGQGYDQGQQVADTQQVGGSYDQPLGGAATGDTSYDQDRSAAYGNTSYDEGGRTSEATNDPIAGRDSATDATYADTGRNVGDDHLAGDGNAARDGHSTGDGYGDGAGRKESFIDKIKDRLTGDDKK